MTLNVVLTRYLEKVDATSQVSDREPDLVKMKSDLADSQPLGALVNCCRTYDQAAALCQFVSAISEKTLRATVSLTAARGRGKSAALGLAMAAAVGFGYSNIFVTSPSPENLNTLFDFVFKGFDALQYEEHLDYEIIQSTNPEFNKVSFILFDLLVNINMMFQFDTILCVNCFSLHD